MNVTNKGTYLRGETIPWTVADRGDASVCTLQVGEASYPMVKDGEGVWSVGLDTSKLSGLVRYAVWADGALVETGEFSVRVLHSQYRAVVEAIDKALQGVATNGKYSVSVGEIALTDKTFDEMLKALGYYKGLVEMEETGHTEEGRVSVIQTRF